MKIATLLAASGLVVAQDPKPEALAKANEGLSLARQAKYSEAVQAYEAAIAIDPSLPAIYLNLGLAWFKLGNFHEAATAFEKENARSPSDQVTTLLAMSYFGLGKYRQAAERLKPLAETQPDNTELSYLLAKCYLWSGQYAEAMGIFKRLLQRDPNSAAVHMLLGEALDAYYRTVDAAAEFEAAAKAAPSQPEVHFGLGYLYWKLKRYEDAGREFREEVKNNPKHPQAIAYLGDVVMKVGRLSEATELLTSAAHLGKDLRIAHFDLGIIYSEKKRYEAAIAEFREAIRIDPARFDAHYHLARLYRQLGRTADADGEFEVVKKLHEKKVEDPLMKVHGPQ